MALTDKVCFDRVLPLEMQRPLAGRRRIERDRPPRTRPRTTGRAAGAFRARIRGEGRISAARPARVGRAISAPYRHRAVVTS